VRITARGSGILTAGVVLLTGGYWFGYAELVALGTACVVALAGAACFVAWRPQLSVLRSVDPDRVTRGEASRVTLTVRNASRLFGASVVARDRLGLAVTGRTVGAAGGIAGRDRTVPVPLVRLRPGRTTTITYPVPTSRRGVIGVGPLVITRRDPLALVGVVRRYGEPALVWVRPRVHPIAAVPVGLSRSMDGRVDRVPHGSMTFAALRGYVVGDDLRRVHWRTSARVGELMVREQVDTSLPRVVVLLDNRARAHTPDETGESTFESACEAAASVVVAAFREDIRVELRLVVADPVDPRPGGRIEVGPTLDLLAEVELVGEEPATNGRARAGPGGPERLRAAVEQLRVRRLGDTLLYLTGTPDEEDLGLVAGLRGAYPSIIAGVFGTVEAGLSTTAGMLVVGATDGADFAAAWDGIRAW
jgi:uncharacterized protein (DUF58 family)